MIDPIYDLNTNERRFVTSYREGNRHRWASCLYAARISERKQVPQVCEELAIHRSTVANLAQAGIFYRELRRWAGKHKKVKRLHFIRNRLTYSHFVMAARYWRILEVPIKDIFNTLEIASDQGASSRDLATYLLAEYGDDDQNQNFWMPVMRRALKEIDNLLNNFATPFDVKLRLKEIRDELRIYLRND